ncbi:GHKL domain-containing protein [Listeria grandensis]|uniref:GHKL domain-containing protein n=1 Tax=Listeria grandensis TaxID=1494963 RepID=A0A7X1CPD8_9LIST|nr:GHKL domain-containing protein [Listeria grandensis]MBC1935842.1 GHKL domain-containing protein [Listeria grandensis]
MNLLIYAILSLAVSITFLAIIGSRRFFFWKDLIFYIGLFIIGYFLFKFEIIPDTIVFDLYLLVIACMIYFHTRSALLAIVVSAINYCLELTIWYFTFGMYHFMFENGASVIYPYLNVSVGITILFYIISIVVYIIAGLVCAHFEKKYNLIAIFESSHKNYYFFTSVIVIGVIVSQFLQVYVYLKYDFQYFVLFGFIAYVMLLIGSTIIVVLVLRAYMQEKYLEEKLVYVDNLEEEQRNVGFFKHDYRNILLSLGIYIENEDFEGLREYYYKELQISSTEAFKSLTQYNDLQNIAILPLKGVIIEKIKFAKEKGIGFRINVPEMVYGMKMSQINQIRCMSVLLDNAIEASPENATIQLELMKEAGEMKISVANRVANGESVSVQKVMQENYSTKGTGRGKGLSSLMKMVNQALGSYSFKQDNGVFTAVLLIPISAK